MTNRVADFNYVGSLKLYHVHLLVIALMYVEEAGWYITSRTPHEYLLDKTNVHRLLELCANSIPIFLHATTTPENVLEFVHQNAKGWLEKILTMTHIYPPWTWH